MRRFYREPLLHFLLLGALLFVAHRYWQRLKPSDAVIVITPALRADLERELAAELGRSPQPAELETAVETWKAEEILFREGQRLGLEQDDPLVRRRVVGKVLELERELSYGREPSDAELDTWLVQFGERYSEATRYDFDQLFVSGPAKEALPRARRIAAELARGAPIEGQGDPFPAGTRFENMKIDGLRQLFGERFAEHVVSLELQRWQTVESVHGLHVVRLTRVLPGRAPERERLRPRLVRDWKLAQREIVMQLVREKYAAHYAFEEVP